MGKNNNKALSLKSVPILQRASKTHADNKSKIQVSSIAGCVIFLLLSAKIENQYRIDNKKMVF